MGDHGVSDNREPTFAEYQYFAGITAQYPDVGNNPVYPTLGLCGEAGEVAEKVKKVIRDNNREFDSEAVDAIKKELGDLMWYLARLASELNLSLGEIARENLIKLKSRQDRGAIQGSGDNR